MKWYFLSLFRPPLGLLVSWWRNQISIHWETLCMHIIKYLYTDKLCMLISNIYTLRNSLRAENQISIHWETLSMLISNIYTLRYTEKVSAGWYQISIHWETLHADIKYLYAEKLRMQISNIYTLRKSLHVDIKYLYTEKVSACWYQISIHWETLHADIKYLYTEKLSACRESNIYTLRNSLHAEKQTSIHLETLCMQISSV